MPYKNYTVTTLGAPDTKVAGFGTAQATFNGDYTLQNADAKTTARYWAKSDGARIQANMQNSPPRWEISRVHELAKVSVQLTGVTVTAYAWINGTNKVYTTMEQPTAVTTVCYTGTNLITGAAVITDVAADHSTITANDVTYTRASASDTDSAFTPFYRDTESDITHTAYAWVNNSTTLYTRLDEPVAGTDNSYTSSDLTTGSAAISAVAADFSTITVSGTTYTRTSSSDVTGLITAACWSDGTNERWTDTATPTTNTTYIYTDSALTTGGVLIDGTNTIYTQEYKTTAAYTTDNSIAEDPLDGTWSVNSLAMESIPTFSTLCTPISGKEVANVVIEIYNQTDMECNVTFRKYAGTEEVFAFSIGLVSLETIAIDHKILVPDGYSFKVGATVAGVRICMNAVESTVV
jgi:hypothetical protein